MSKEIMERRAADNKYLHKDFHGALSGGLDYLAEHYGEEAVRDYLREFTQVYYAPLREQLRTYGLIALKEHFEKLYATEGGEIEIDFSEDELVLRVAACPAVMHLREHDYTVSPYFVETTKTVNEVLCEESDFVFELLEYDSETGRSILRFFRHLSPDTRHSSGECS